MPGLAREHTGDLWTAFRITAAVHRRAVALAFADGDVTFAELEAGALRVARWLGDQGIGRGDVVAIGLPKRRESYVLSLACLRQGCPYVFVDPRNPPPRTDAILARLKPRLLVAVDETENPHGRTLRLATAGEGGHWLAGLPEGAPPPAPALHGLDPAYVMFTSGSTGEPKGAVIPHQGVLSLMRWARRSIAAPDGARFSNINPLHFDNAVFDLYGGLVNGATLVPIETAEMANPAQWVRRLREGGATVIFAVPTLFQTLDRLKLLRPESLPGARLLMFGGEGFPAAQLAEIHARFTPLTRLVNVYGPTETSCICSSLEIDQVALAAAGAGFPSLGRMHADFDYAILDDAGHPVAADTPGELWIGGTNVGLGYYANTEETRRRFVQNPLQTAYRAIWYRTGDLVREDAAGLLWFSGRVDNQVKIRGHRIELEEIDLAIGTYPSVKRAIAVAVAGPDGPELCAAIEAGRALAIEDVRAHCADLLPPYMQPTRIIQVDILPQNANGKVDRRAVAKLIGDAL